MKIKWKIVLAAVSIIVVLTTSIVFFSYAEVRKLVDEQMSEELRNYSAMGERFLDTQYEGNWNLKGADLYKGDTLINGNFSVIDNLTKDTSILATVFMGDTRISTNVVSDAGERQVGTQASQPVIDTVLTNEKDFEGSAEILGKMAKTLYVPIYDSSNKVIGMWFVGVYSDVINSKIDDAMIIIVALALAMLVIGVGASFVLGNAIGKKIGHVKEKIKLMEIGDFSISFDEKLLKRKDEIGEIAVSVDHMQDKVSSIIKGIQEESQKVRSATEYAEESIEVVHGNIEDISATTEELSAGMEETSASTQEMNASTYEVEEEVSNMKQKTVNGENLAKEIKIRAEKLMEETHISRTNTNEIYDKTNKQLRDSIEKTSAIEEIKELSQTILEITSQTNLLALNAAN